LNTESKTVQRTLRKDRTKVRKKKIIISAKIKTPSRNASEFPILLTLSRAQGYSLKTKIVLQLVRKSFDELDENDLRARYRISGQNVVNTIIKFSKKQLVSKKLVYPVGENCELGTWKLTTAGLQRARDGGADWRARYTYRDAVILEEA
jgi:hypothetical protein